jgi:hypothetical protein
MNLILGEIGGLSGELDLYADFLSMIRSYPEAKNWTSEKFQAHAYIVLIVKRILNYSDYCSYPVTVVKDFTLTRQSAHRWQ